MCLSSYVLIFAELELMLLHQFKLMDGDAKRCVLWDLKPLLGQSSNMPDPYETTHSYWGLLFRFGRERLWHATKHLPTLASQLGQKKWHEMNYERCSWTFAFGWTHFREMCTGMCWHISSPKTADGRGNRKEFLNPSMSRRVPNLK